MMKFKIGDVVTLKSGGAKMVIQEITPNHDNSYNCLCTWIDTSGKPYEARYDQLTLEINAND